MTEIVYHPIMGVQRMTIAVPIEGLSPPNTQAGAVSRPEVIPLVWGGHSPLLAAGVAASCGLRPAGFLTECVSRPGRRVHAWGAAVRPEQAGGSTSRPPEPLASIAGVILLAESTPSTGGPPRLSIPWLLVRPDSRRLGVGRALVAAALNHALGLGGRRVTIDTLDRWPEALAFWREMGFHGPGRS